MKHPSRCSMTRKRMLCFVLTVGLLAGCKQDSQETPVVFEGAERIPITQVGELPLFSLAENGAQPAGWTMFAVEEGLFYFDEESRLMMYEDWVGNTVYPLCVRPNCTHSSEECDAWFSEQSGAPQYLHFDGEHLYYYQSDTKGFYSQNLDGTEKTRILDVSDCMGIDSTVVYQGKQVFFVAELGKEVDGAYQKTLHIGSGDLTTGKVTLYPNAFSDQLSIYGLYDGKLVLANQLYQAETMTSGTMPKSSTTTFLFDLETQEITVLMEGTDTRNSAVGRGGIHLGVFSITLFSGEEETMTLNGSEAPFFDGTVYLFDLARGQCYSCPLGKTTWEPSVLDGKLIYPFAEESEDPSMVILDLASGEKLPYPDSMDSYGFWGGYSESEDWFFLTRQDSEGSLRLYRVRKSDFYQDDFSPIPMMVGGA